MSKKILLISPNFEEVSLVTASKKFPAGIKTADTSHYPMGLASLHAYLESRGFAVASLFLNSVGSKECFDEVIGEVEKFCPDVIGLQMMTPNRAGCYRLIEYFHKNYPAISLVVGGIHATIMHRQLLAKYPYLIVALGEGEITFAELAQELYLPASDLSKIDGLAFCRDGEIIKTKERALIADLDNLPFINHGRYFKDNSARRVGCIITSRGCPFNCSFCCLESVSRRRVRLRSAKNVVDEIEGMARNIPQMSKIWIHDDTFFIDNQRVIDICDEIIRRGIKKEFIASGRVKPLSRRVVEKLAQAGFRKILLGLESGNEKILKACHKGITLKDVEEALKLFVGVNIAVTMFLIVGLPGETRATIKDTAKFVKKLQRIKYIYYSEVSVLTVYPGTEVYEILKAAGQISDDFWLTGEPTPLFTAEHSAGELLKLKETLLDSIAIDRFLTPAGFISQINMLPQIIRYVYGKPSILRTMLTQSLRTFLPAGAFLAAKRAYHALKA